MAFQSYAQWAKARQVEIQEQLDDGAVIMAPCNECPGEGLTCDLCNDSGLIEADFAHEVKSAYTHAKYVKYQLAAIQKLCIEMPSILQFEIMSQAFSEYARSQGIEV